MIAAIIASTIGCKMPLIVPSNWFRQCSENVNGKAATGGGNDNVQRCCTFEERRKCKALFLVLSSDSRFMRL